VVYLRRPGLPAADAEGDRRLERDRGETPIPRRAERDALRRRRAVAGIDLLALAVQNASHRAAELPGERGGNVRRLLRAVLRAEAAAHVLLDHAYLRELQAKCRRDVGAGVEDSLRGFPDSDMIARPFGDSAMRLHGCV
jgi:hypothetical protein